MPLELWGILLWGAGSGLLFGCRIRLAGADPSDCSAEVRIEGLACVSIGAKAFEFTADALPRIKGVSRFVNHRNRRFVRCGGGKRAGRHRSIRRAIVSPSCCHRFLCFLLTTGQFPYRGGTNDGCVGRTSVSGTIEAGPSCQVGFFGLVWFGEDAGRPGRDDCGVP